MGVKVFTDHMHTKLRSYLPEYNWHVEWDSIGQQYIIKAKEIQNDG